MEERTDIGKAGFSVREICEAAVLLAIAFVLSFVKVYELPNGGSVSAASMLPVLIIGVRRGPKLGFGAAFVFSLMQFFGGIYAITPIALFLDYIAAYTVYGFAGFFKGKKYGLIMAVPICGFLRFVVHLVSGATIWAETMPDEFFGMTMTNPWFYSLLYNGSYMLPEILLTIVAAVLIRVPLKKYIGGPEI